MDGNNRMDNIFGYNPTGKVNELKQVNSDAWPLISSTTSGEAQRSTPRRNPQQGQLSQQRRPQTSSKPQDKKPDKKKDKGYVGSKTGLGKKKAEAPKERISQSQSTRNTSQSRNTANKRPVSDNNKRRTTAERTPKGERVAPTNQGRNGRRPSERPQPNGRPSNQRTNLTKQQEREIRRQKEIYERGRRQGKSKDEIRREEQRRQIQMRKIKTFTVFVAFIATVIFAIGAYVYNSVALVQNINIEGGSTYSMKKIIKNCGIVEGDKLLAVREKRVREILTKELPYIKDATVSYGFPNTVTITVSSTEDKFLIADKNKYLRLDKDGKVLSASKTKMKDGLYKIEGLTYVKTEVSKIFEPAKADKEKYEMAKAVALEAEKAGLVKGTVDVTDMGKITFTYDGRIRIYLGDAKELQTKMDFAAKTIASAASGNKTGYIDMRFSERGYFSEGSMDNT